MSVGAMIAGNSGQRYDQRANMNGKKNLNIFDANASHALQKQMNSSRFGGFRTADGASQSKQLGNIHGHNSNVGAGAEESFGFMKQATQVHDRNAYAPQSPISNQSFHQHTNVENRRARPKIVKTSHDHGNMFFIQ